MDHSTQRDRHNAVQDLKSDISKPESTSRRLRRLRKGCKECKKRHIKCDDSRPICKSCLARGLNCDLAGTIHVPPMINYSMVQNWRNDCESTHGACCNDRHSEALEQQLQTLNLVDVVQGNLITLPASTPFVALSYVWGSVATLKAERSNLEDLQKRGSLFGEPYASAIPDTIRDAMHVVRAFGERYLWVDCLSLIQDAERAEMERMLKAMARIYASAEFTIVAAEGDDANHGLRGAGGPSCFRKQTTSQDATILTTYRGFPFSSRWASRGWTFQESLFSRRLLVFDKVVSWICGRLIRIEGSRNTELVDVTTTEPIEWPHQRPHLGVPMGIMALIPDHPSLGRWGMIIEKYSSRNLTWEGDILRAFAGATEIMSNTFPGGLYQGLPMFFFDIALLWQPEEQLQRRHGQPSWSWTGWKGRVDCLNAWHPFFAGVYRHSGSYMDWIPIAPLKPLVTWDISSTRQGQVLNNSHFNEFYVYQEMRKFDDSKLPSGWCRNSHNKGDYFTDSNFPNSVSQFSFPLPATKAIQPVGVNDLNPILFFTAPTMTMAITNSMTQRVIDDPYMRGYDSLPGAFWLIPLPTAKLSSQDVEPSIAGSRSKIGLVGANFWSKMARTKGQNRKQDVSIGSLVTHSEVEAEDYQHCELAAISEGQLDDLERAASHNLLYSYMESQGWIREEKLETPKDPEDRKFYNVLWIERDGEISYRKGLGMVSKRRWDALEPTVQSIKLG